jgi:glycosidase
VLAFYRRLIWLRKSSPALQTGDFAWEVRARSGVLAYWRTAHDERVLVAINTRASTASITLPDDASWLVLCTTALAPTGPVGPGALRLRPHEALILRRLSP